MVAAVEMNSAQEKLENANQRVVCDWCRNNGPDYHRHHNLPSKDEPTSNPRCEWSTSRLGNYGCPVIWTTAGRMCAAYFWSCSLQTQHSPLLNAERGRTCHSQADHHREEGYLTFNVSQTLR